MCETMQSSHRLRPVMALVRVLLAAPTASGDGAVEWRDGKGSAVGGRIALSRTFVAPAFTAEVSL